MLTRTLSLVAIAALAMPTLAQERQTQTRQTDRAQTGQRMQADRPMGTAGDASAVPTDALVRWISQDNQAEVALAEFAKQKTENPAVRDFAQKMIDAHTKFGRKLDGVSRPDAAGSGNRRASAYRGGAADPAADPSADPGAADELVVDLAEPGDPTLADPTDPPTADRRTRAADRTDRDRTDRRTTRAQNRNEAGRMNRGATAADLLAFRKELKQKCGETLKQNFDKLPPAEFDKAYSSQQIGAHLAMIDTLALAEKQADGQAAEVFRAGKMETQKHLMEAIGLLNSVTPMNPTADN